jgi:hypothetical protein
MGNITDGKPRWLSVNDQDQFHKGLVAYRQGDYFRAHEEWEELWASYATPERTFLQGLIQLAVSLVHLENGNLKGARNLLRKAREKLAPYHGVTWGLDVDALKCDLGELQETYHRLQRPDEFDRSAIPRLQEKG